MISKVMCFFVRVINPTIDSRQINLRAYIFVTFPHVFVVCTVTVLKCFHVHSTALVRNAKSEQFKSMSSGV
jgi:hypothetical protein